MTRIITGVFDNRGDVERTVEHLTQEFGIDPGKVVAHGTGGEGVAAGEVPSLERLALPGADRHAYEEAMRRELADARLQLSERKVVERAKGILMSRHGLSEEQAYGRLRKTAMDRGLKLAEVAQRVVDVADLLG